MASVLKRNDKYVVRYDYKDSKGKRRQKWEEFNTKNEANKFKTEIELKKLNDDFITPSETTVEQFLNEWIEIHAKANWQYKTYESSRYMIKKHIIPAIGQMILQKLKPKEIEVFFNDLREKKMINTKGTQKINSPDKYLSPTTIGHIYTLLKSALDKAVEWGVITKNPVLCIKPQRAKPKHSVWSADQMKTALKNIEDIQLRLAVHLSFVCSLRIGEVLGIVWDCVNFEKKEIHIRSTLQRISINALNLLPKDHLHMIVDAKNPTASSVLVLKAPKTESSDRIVYMTDKLVEELIQYKQYQNFHKNEFDNRYKDCNFIFTIEDGYPIEPNLCLRRFKRWQNQSDINLPKIVFHSLRHSSTTYKLALSGGDIKSVQGDTGHATADMVVNTYSHIQDEARKNMLDLLEQNFYGDSDVINSNNFVDDDLVEIIKNNPSLRNKLLMILEAEKLPKNE
jgi:Site-specific recombinase XerD